MKKIIVILVAMFCVHTQSHAQLGIITGLIKKVIRAIDLQVQRLQTQTIWLQDAQRVVENTMHQLKLTDIANWSDKQKSLYENYYNELWTVKNLIGGYQKVKDIITKQTQMVAAYKQASNLFHQDSHFNASELDYMEHVYSGIIDESLKNLEQVYLVVSSFSTQMSDAKRLELIEAASKKIDGNYNDIKQFNNQNIKLSLQRAKDLNDVNTIKQLYGIAP